jgi:hypothetical protein
LKAVANSSGDSNKLELWGGLTNNQGAGNCGETYTCDTDTLGEKKQRLEKLFEKGRTM